MAATSLNPPRPTIDWSNVSSSSFLEEFEFLGDDEICHKRWAQPAIHAVMRQAKWIKQAHTELIHCNVELHCLHTSIIDEERMFADVLNHLLANNSKIYPAVLDYCSCRQRANEINLQRITQTYALDGFTRIPFPGVRKGAVVSANASSQSLEMVGATFPAATDIPSQSSNTVCEDVDDLSDDDKLTGEFDKVVNYISSV